MEFWFIGMLRRVDCARDWLNARSRIIFETRKLTNSIWSSRHRHNSNFDRTSRKKLSRKRGCFRPIVKWAGRFFRWPDNKQTNKQAGSSPPREIWPRAIRGTLLLNFKSQSLSVALHKRNRLSVAAVTQSSACSLAKQELPRAFSRSLLFLSSPLPESSRDLGPRPRLEDLINRGNENSVWTKF